MKKFIQISVFLWLLFIGFTQDLYANSILGSDMQWKSMGNDSFEIKVIIYRRCSGGATSLSMSAPTITSDSSSYNYTVTIGSLIEHLTEDVTPVCATQPKVCPSSGGIGNETDQVPVGIEKHTFRYKLFLGGDYANCCWYKISLHLCCRSINITTGYAGTDFYSDSWLNRCVNDNSPESVNSPIAIICRMQDINYNPGVFDNDGDSLSYTLAQPSGGSYNSPFNYTYPLTCNGGNNPNPNATPITGFNFNPMNGEMNFRPVSLQSTVLKTIVTEWRKNSNGVYKVIGKTAREMQFIIPLICSNKSPDLFGPFIYEACAGSQKCISIWSNDPEGIQHGQGTNMQMNVGNTSATWSPGWDDTWPSTAHGSLCWTPSESDISSIPHYFIATVKDTHCPLSGITVRTYAITVKPPLRSNSKVTMIKSGKYKVQVTNNDSLQRKAEKIIFYTATKLGNSLSTMIQSQIQNHDSAEFYYYFGDEGKFIIRTVVISGACSDTHLDTVIINYHPQINKIRGSLFCSVNNDCKQDSDEPSVSNIIISTVPFTNAVITNELGKYNFYLDSGNFRIVPTYPGFLYKIKNKTICPSSGNIDLSLTNQFIDSSGNNFALDVIRVPILSIDFMQTGMRPCTQHNGYLYCSNIGTKDTFNVKVSLVLPPNTPYISSSQPCIRHGDSLLFSIDTLKSGAMVTIIVLTSVDCNTALTGEYRCFKFGISPDNKRYTTLLTNTNYDNSIIKTKAECLDSNYIKFSILNEGQSMNDSNEYRLYENSRLCFKGKFKLDANDKKDFIIKSAGYTYRMEANQNFYYPTYSNPCSIIRSCWNGSFNDNNNFNELPPYYEGFNYKEKCCQIINSHDPNAISIIPAGVGNQRTVKRKEPLHYTIDFQNTGKDTAYDVIVMDTLSDLLDISTLEIGMASHKFTTEITGNDNKKIIKFVFNNIHLVDSNTDEKNSHGFVTYTIMPFDNIPSGSKIDSHAFIYFDFNDAVETNTAFVSINDSIPKSSDFPIQTYPVPNIVLDTINDMCADGAPFDLNIRSNLNIEYISSTQGHWYINGLPLNGSVFNPNLIHIPLGNTSPVKVTAKYIFTSFGCYNIDSVIFYIHPVPTVVIKVPKSHYAECDTAIQILNITGTSPLDGNSKSRFFIDNNEITPSNSFIPNSYKVGSHKVMLLFKTTQGCTGYAEDSFYIEPMPVVTVNPIRNLCEAVAINPDSGFALEATINAPYTGHWTNYTGTFIRGTTENDKKAFYAPGILELSNGAISLEWESIPSSLANQCEKVTAKATALIYAMPVFNITSSDTTGCFPYTASFSANIKNALSIISIYAWDFGDPGSGTSNFSSSATPSHTFSAPGKYNINCTITNSKGGCAVNEQMPSNIEVFDYARPWFTYTPDSPGYTTAASPKYVLKGMNNNSNVTIKYWKWWWDEPVNYAQPGALMQNAEHVYAEDTGIHTITLQVTTAEGCVTEVKRNVKINPDVTVFIPNAFSPDDDILNEKYMVVAMGIKSFEMFIYNRWGENMYHSNNYLTHGWDGLYENKEAPMDTYIYKVMVTGYDGRRYVYDGTVQLIR